jgi:dihydrofolate reductase
MMISIIVAAAENGVIGAGGQLPWKLSDDLKRFKAVTMGKPIVMGRKTWESIGRPLPGRQNIVITRQAGFEAAGCDVVASPQDAVALAGEADEIMVIGGSQVYDLFLPEADRVYLTRVHADVEGDAFFAVLDQDEWRMVSDERHRADERNEFDYSFRLYERTGRS